MCKMSLKEQKRKCLNCLTVESRIVTQEESVFMESKKYFLNWGSNCAFCNTNQFESISESYLTDNIEEMKISDSIIDLWRVDNSKRFNPQDDYIEFSNIAIEKILLWIDKIDTTSLKRKILVESLCYRLDDLISEEILSDERNLITTEFRKRKTVIEENLDFLDSETRNVIINSLKG